MNPTVPDPAPDRDAATGVDTWGRLCLVFVGFLGLVFLLARLLGGPTGIEQREARIVEIEKAWAARADDTGAVEAIREQSDRAEVWEKVLGTSVGHRKWRERGQRGAAPTRPPDPPANLRARLGPAGEKIVLEWDPIEDVDRIDVLLSTRQGEGATKITAIHGDATTWEDDLRAISGTYTYSLRSVRNDLESRGTSNEAKVAFDVPFRVEIQSLDRDGEVAWILVGPRPNGPRPSLFAPERFRVRPNEVVGTQALRFDYATGYVFHSIFEVASTTLEERADVPVFTPDGTRARDADGKPVFKTAFEKRDITLVKVVLKKDGAEDVILTVPR